MIQNISEFPARARAMGLDPVRNSILRDGASRSLKMTWCVWLE
jgi:hypothetical protein